jgi:hypothetical protein
MQRFIAALPALLFLLAGSTVGCSAQDEEPAPASVREGVAKHLHSFAVFRTPAEGLPKSITDVLPRSVHGVDWKQAQLLRESSASSSSVWAVPGDRHICLFSQDKPPYVGATCDSIPRALKRGVAITLLQTSDRREGPSRLIIGIVPESTQRVVVKTGRSSFSVDVSQGEFIWRDDIASPPDRIALVGRSR